MWFEILPSFAVVTLALAAPGYAIYGLHKLVLGNVSELNFRSKCLSNVVYITKKC